MAGLAWIAAAAAHAGASEPGVVVAIDEPGGSVETAEPVAVPAWEGAHLASRPTLFAVRAGRPIAWSAQWATSTKLSAREPGRTTVDVTRGPLRSQVDVDVIALDWRRADGRRSAALRAGAAMALSVPSTRPPEAIRSQDEPESLRLVVRLGPGVPESTLDRLDVGTLDAAARPLDRLDRPFGSPHRRFHDAYACKSARCFATLPIRLTADPRDRKSVLGGNRTLLAVPGGAIALVSGGARLAHVRVRGAEDPGVFRLRVEGVVVRATAGGPAAIGASDAEATSIAAQELGRALIPWAPCGLVLDPATDREVSVRTVRAESVLGVGDPLGFRATGGEVRFGVGGRGVRLSVARGESAETLAMRIARELGRVGLDAEVSRNARTLASADPTYDVRVRSAGQRALEIRPIAADRALSTDRTMPVRVRSLDLERGLDHFGDADSSAGTLDERALVKSLGRRDPSAVEAIFVPEFHGGARMGESFIVADQSSLRNVVIVDRSAVRTQRSASTLAHELGHVLLNEPGHPDDFGVDTPNLLMDADASDASVFGPRRVTREQCARVMAESGPKGRVPLLEPVTLGPLPSGAIRWDQPKPERVIE